jgi:hypothetical protein
MDDCLDLFAHALGGLSQKHGDLPLAVRVEVTGASAAHGELLASAAATTNQFRAAAIDAARCGVWIEKVKIGTRPLTEANGEANGDLESGPLGEMRRQLAEMRGDDAPWSEISAELADLAKKLPAELCQDEDGFQLANPVWMRRWLDDVEAMLASRMGAGPIDR